MALPPCPCGRPVLHTGSSSSYYGSPTMVTYLHEDEYCVWSLYEVRGLRGVKRMWRRSWHWNRA